MAVEIEIKDLPTGETVVVDAETVAELTDTVRDGAEQADGNGGSPPVETTENIAETIVVDATDAAAPVPSPTTAPATKPVDGYDPDDWLDLIQNRDDAVTYARNAMENSKATAKAKKEAYEVAVDKLREIIADHHAAKNGWLRPLPLIDGENSAAAATATSEPPFPAVESTAATQADADAWKAVSIDELNLPGKLPAKLRDNSIETIGQLETVRAGRGGLLAIKGIGAGKVTIIENAVVDWLSTNRDAAELAAAEMKVASATGVAVDDI